MGGTDFDDTSNPSQYWNAVNSMPSQSSAKSYIPETTWNESCVEFGQLNGCTSVSSDGSDLVAASGGVRGAFIDQSGAPAAEVMTSLPDMAYPMTVLVCVPVRKQRRDCSFYIMCQADANPDPASSCNLTRPYQDFQGVGGNIRTHARLRGYHRAGQSKDRPTPGRNYVLTRLVAQNGSSCTSNAAAAGTSSCAFYDVVKGNNSVACQAGSPNCSNTSSSGYGVLVDPSHTSSPAWTTTAGYDLATGLGSVNVTNLVKNWASVSFAPTTTTLSVRPSSPMARQST